MFCLLIKNSLLFWGLRCGFALRRYVPQLAIRSALRGLRPLGLA